MPTDMFEALAAPFPPDAISWRVGSTTQDKTKGMALAYLDARDVMERLDHVCGADGWERRHPHVGGTTTCEIAIWVEGRGWVVKSDGAGDTAVEAEKGSLSDSFKRAAVNWGIGRYLYGLSSPWVELEGAGRSVRIKQSEYPKLRALLSKTGAPVTPCAAPVEPASNVRTGRSINTPLDAFIAAMKMNKTVEKVDAWAAREANAIVEKLNPRDQAAMQEAFEAYRKILQAIPDTKEKSLGDRAFHLEQALKACTVVDQAERVRDRGQQLLDELDRRDPERRAEIDALLAGLLATLPAMEPA